MSPLVRRYRDLETGREAVRLHELVEPGRPLDPGGLSDLLAFGYLAGRRTLLRGVERVLQPLRLPEPPRLPADQEAQMEELENLTETPGGPSRP